MAPKRDTASQATQGRGRHQQIHQHLDATSSPEIDALQALTATLQYKNRCYSTCSCSNIKDIAAAMRQLERPSGDGLLQMISVLSSLAAVLIEGQHSCEAQREALGLFDRYVVLSLQQHLCVQRPVSAAWPCDASTTYQPASCRAAERSCLFSQCDSSCPADLCAQACCHTCLLGLPIGQVSRRHVQKLPG